MISCTVSDIGARRAMSSSILRHESAARLERRLRCYEIIHGCSLFQLNAIDWFVCASILVCCTTCVVPDEKGFGVIPETRLPR